MIDLIKLKVHHIGVVVSEQQFQFLTVNRHFNTDQIQGVRTLFVWSKELRCYIEYFTNTGRAKNYSFGFNHVCYQISDIEAFNALVRDIRASKMGIQVTQLEESGSKECGRVAFFFLTGIGLVEFNIDD